MFFLFIFFINIILLRWHGWLVGCPGALPAAQYTLPVCLYLSLYIQIFSLRVHFLTWLHFASSPVDP